MITLNNTITFTGQLFKEASGIFLSAESQCASQIQSNLTTISRRKQCVLCELLHDLVNTQLSSHFPTFPVLGIPKFQSACSSQNSLHCFTSPCLCSCWFLGQMALDCCSGFKWLFLPSFPSLLGTREDFAPLHPLWWDDAMQVVLVNGLQAHSAHLTDRTGLNSSVHRYRLSYILLLVFCT